MPDRIQEEDLIYQVNSFALGMVASSAHITSPLNSLRWAEGCLIDDGGAIVRRHGFNSELGTLSTAVTSNHRAVTSMTAAGEGAQKKLYLTVHEPSSSSLDIYAWDGSSWLTDASGDHLAGAPASGSVTTHQSTWVRESDGDEFIYFANPYGSLVKAPIGGVGVNPTGVVVSSATNTNPPGNCRLILSFRDRIWMAGVDGTDRDGLYYSNLLEPETWDQAGKRIAVGAMGGERITAIHPFIDNLLFIGTENSIYLLAVGSSTQLLDWDLRTVTNSIGVGASMSVVSGGGDVFFVDSSGEVRSLRKTISDVTVGGDLEPLSAPIAEQARFVSLSPSTTGVQASVAYFYDGHLWVWGSEGAYNSGKQVGWAYNAKRGLWTGPHYLKKDAYTSASDPLGGTVGIADREDPENLTGSFDFDPITVATVTHNDFGTANGAWGTGQSPTVVIASHGTKTNNAIDSAWDDQRVLVYDINPSDESREDYASTGVALDFMTHLLDFAVPDRKKYVKWVEVEWGAELGTAAMDEQKFRILGRTDPDGLWTPLSDVTDTSNLGRTKVNTRILGLSRLFQFRVARQDTTDQSLRIHSMRVSFEVQEVEDV